MNSEKLCDGFLNQLSGDQPETAEFKKHLNDCAICQSRRRALAGIKEKKTAYVQGASVELKRRIMSAFDQEMEVKAESPGIFPNTSVLGLLGGAAILSMVILLFIFRPQQSDPEGFTLALNGGAPVRLRPGSPIELAWGSSGSILGADGSVLSLVGPGKITIFSRGFDLQTGRLKARIHPGIATYSGSTPHGKIEVVGTVFFCEVDAVTTLIEVDEGKVLVTPQGKPPVLLIASQSLDMLHSDRIIEGPLPGGVGVSPRSSSESRIIPKSGNPTGNFSPEDLGTPPK